MSRPVRFTKGHGTRNDFVIVEDASGEHDLEPADVRFLCDRRGGVGGDGVLRVTRGAAISEWDGDPDVWFMDYRNADGSIAEMCGNGVRVFAAYLRSAGLIEPDAASVDLGTRAGLKTATFTPDGEVRVRIGRPAVEVGAVTIDSVGGSWPATAVDVGNPHAVVLLTDDTLDRLDLGRMPSWTPHGRFPDQVNVEFVREDGPGEFSMRVYERGVGETQSCGTGTVAAASAVAAAHGETDASYTVHIPGGTVRVDLAGGEAFLTGPAELTFTGEIELPDAAGE